ILPSHAGRRKLGIIQLPRICPVVEWLIRRWYRQWLLCYSAIRRQLRGIRRRRYPDLVIRNV
ncbi:hypothetical protein HDU81_000885, partial [Chytriomyces hyalinus]